MTPSACLGCHAPLGGQHKPSCYRQGLVSEESLLPAPLRSGPGETEDLAGALGLTDSVERQLGVVMLSQKAIRDIGTQLGLAERYRGIANRLMEIYSAVFPNYAWTDEESAIDLMDAEIKAARLERDHLLGGLKKIAALKKPHPKNRDAHEAVRLAVEYLDFGTAISRFEPPSSHTPQPLSKTASMDRLAATMERKTGEIEAAGLCQWGYCTVASDLDRVWADIRQCRANQDEQWGGPEHDDTHAAHEWLGFIQKQLVEADIALDPPPGGSNLDIYESRLIDVAALAVAAIQSNRRKRNA